jgi:environmental stress-induced protein Ves
MDATTVLRWDELEAMPWKNGGGSTRNVAAAPAGSGPGHFDWRVSIAEVAADGPFSAFPGVERVIMLVDGGEMALEVDGVTHWLERFDVLAFSGEATTLCRVPSGPTRDLNLMTRGDCATGTVHRVDVAGRYEAAVGEGEVLVLVALSSGLDGLGTLDSVMRDGAGQVAVTGTGTVGEIRIHPRSCRSVGHCVRGLTRAPDGGLSPTVRQQSAAFCSTPQTL